MKKSPDSMRAASWMEKRQVVAIDTSHSFLGLPINRRDVTATWQSLFQPRSPDLKLDEREKELRQYEFDGWCGLNLVSYRSTKGASKALQSQIS